MNEQGVSPIAVTGDHVRLYREFLTRAGRRPATIARALTVIRGTYERFGKKHLLPWEQVRDIQAVTAPRVDKNTTPELSETDAIRLLEAPDRSTLLGMRDFGLLFAYFRTACRSRALAHAAVGDLEESSDGLAIVVLEKGAKQRRLLLLDAGPAVQSWLRTAGIADDSDSPLFPALAPDRKTLTRRHLTQQAILNVVKKYAAQIGLTVSPTGRRGLCTHSLRKTAAVNAADHGAPVEQIRAWLGHSDLRTTQTYLTERETDAEHAARRCQIRPK